MACAANFLGDVSLEDAEMMVGLGTEDNLHYFRKAFSKGSRKAEEMYKCTGLPQAGLSTAEMAKIR